MRSLPTLGGKCRILPSRRREGHSRALLTPEGVTREGEEAPVSPAPPALLPLREAPPGPDAPAGAPPRLIYVPFSTSDLYNWKHQNPPFSEKPQELISLLETIFRTHQPTWDGCQTLFTSGKGKESIGRLQRLCWEKGRELLQLAKS